LLSGTRYFLDANIIIFLMKGRNSALSRNFERAVIGGLRFLLPVLVRQEVEVGVLRNANVSGARAKLNRILSFVEGAWYPMKLKMAFWPLKFTTIFCSAG
jgi:predicted nucleic acid-binding protein